MSSTASTANGAATAATSASSAAPPASSALPGYYTAYWAQQQQQQAGAHPPAAANFYPGYSYPSYPYGYYPQQQPTPSQPPPSSNGTTATAVPPPSAAASAAASSTAAPDAAAVAAYQKEYAEWYHNHYEPYMAAQAAAQQQPQPHYPHPTQPPHTPATAPPPSTYPPPQTAPPAAHSSTSPANANPAVSYPYTAPHSAAYPPHSYPTHPSSSTAPSHPAPASTPFPPSSTLPQPPPPSTSRRSRWSDSSSEPFAASTALPPSHPSSAPSSSPSPASTAHPSTASSAWPPDLIEYVKRSLQFCPAHSKADVERSMRDRIQAAVNSGDLHRIDWRAEPLAHTRYLAEQLKAKFLASVHPSPSPDEHTVRVAREAEEERQRQDRANHRHQVKGERKRGRDSDEKRRDYSSSSSDDDAHILPSDRSTRQRRTRRSKPAKGPEWAVDPVDRSRNSDRASRFSAYLQEAAAAPMKSRIRTELFSTSSHHPVAGAGFTGEDEEGIDWSALKIVGTSTALEKSYFRLTSAPDPATVRPPAVLKAALDRLLGQWRENGEYPYLCDQMKAIRQDLTVQHVQDAFTVSVYEQHARIALRVGDLSEYNQCQTQLRQLYQEVTGEARGNEVEFLMYRLCYCMITGNQGAISALLRELGEGQRREPAIAYVLRLRQAVAMDDFNTFLRGYRETPYAGMYLLQHVVGRMRLRGLKALVRGYKPTKVGVRMFQESLGFEGKAECVRYLVSCGTDVSEDGETVITAGSDIHEPDVEEDEGGKEEKHGITHALFALPSG